MNKNAAMAVTIIAILALPILASLFANSLQPVLSNPMIPVPGSPSTTSTSGITSAESYNWAGYAVVTSGTNKVTDVKGSWTVPAATATCNANQEWDSSFWVGIDGYKSSTVEQTGTDTYCYEGTVSYYAWYEFYPAASITITTHTVSPGDSMSAEVKWISSLSTFKLSIKDITAGWAFSTTGSVSVAKRNSAEWIAESPFDILGELPLTPFGTAYFTSDTAATTTHTGAIGTFAAGVYVINGVCFPSKLPVKLSTSGLDVTGANFNVENLNPGPEG